MLTLLLRSNYEVRVTHVEAIYRASAGATIACTAGAGRGQTRVAALVVATTIACTAGAGRGATRVASVSGPVTIAATAGGARGAGSQATITGVGYQIRITWVEATYRIGAGYLSATAGRAAGGGIQAQIVNGFVLETRPGAAAARGRTVSVAGAGYQVRVTWVESTYRPRQGADTVLCFAGPAASSLRRATIFAPELLPFTAGRARAAGPRPFVFTVVDELVCGPAEAGASGIRDASFAILEELQLGPGAAAARGGPVSILSAATIISCTAGRARAGGLQSTVAVVQPVLPSVARAVGRGGQVAILQGPSGPSIFCVRARAAGAGQRAAFQSTTTCTTGRAGARGRPVTLESGIVLYASGTVRAVTALDPALTEARGTIGAFAYLDAGTGRTHGLFKMRSRLTPDMRMNVREN